MSDPRLPCKARLFLYGWAAIEEEPCEAGPIYETTVRILTGEVRTYEACPRCARQIEGVLQEARTEGHERGSDD